MENEPVAWIDPKELDMDVSTSVTKHKQFDTDIPLYTHPAKPIDKPDECISGCPENQTCDYCAGIKTLTDEEIIKVNEDIGTCWDVPHRFAIQIARAILRKAQEK